jgi:hypothetical protein
VSVRRAERLIGSSIVAVIVGLAGFLFGGGSAARADNGGYVTLGAYCDEETGGTNCATLPTIVGRTSEGLALHVFATNGIGIIAEAEGSPVTPGQERAGVVGRGHSNGSDGVVGHGGRFGVNGDGGVVGVGGTSDSNTGVYGRGGLIGVHAVSGQEGETGVGLRVDGRTVFQTAGKAVVSAGKASKTVLLAGVTTNDFVLATAQGNPAVWVRSASAGSGQFTIRLSKASTKSVTVAYFVVSTA